MRLLAKTKGGECLSRRIISVNHPLLWRCAKGHTWRTAPNNIHHGTWCRICSDLGRVKHSIEDMRELAHRNGGKCLSTQYIDLQTPLKWECAEGHVWETTPGQVVVMGQWCPECGTNLHEKICRAALQAFLNKSFPRCRPKWLRNQKGNLIELDGYSEKLRLAFEYQGIQHYTISHYSKDYRLGDIRSNDKHKIRICRSRGVKLIRIPYTVKKENLPDFLFKRCIKLGYKIPKRRLSTFDWHNITSPKRIEEMHSIARKREGVCLSDHYLTAMSPMMWQCQKGHTWMAPPNRIKNGAWCPECANIKRKTIEYPRELARVKGGECLSKVYINANTKMLWRCAHGHEWHTTTGCIQSGTWCCVCAGKKPKTIAEMRARAKKLNGRCLSKVYQNNKTALVWECEKGHQWRAPWHRINTGKSWCPVCNTGGPGRNKVSVKNKGV